MSRPLLVLVTPALAAANNGNWQTARRWARMLSNDYEVQLTGAWQGGDAAVMIALHARRSAASIAAWRAAHPSRPLVVVLTGTDLYRDIAVDAAARQSLALADRLVVLNELGARPLPPDLQARVRVCLQSTQARVRLDKTRRHLRVLMVGHLREEKSPRTLFEAVRHLWAAQRLDIRVDHIGAPLDERLGAEATRLARDCPNYRWLGALDHEATRRHIQRAHVLVHASLMEGGAHVVIEAVTSGTPVIASHIDGNLGLLGADYRGCFAPGDAAGLARLIEQARDEPAMLAGLQTQCDARAPLFQPAHERASLLALLSELRGPPRAAVATQVPV